MRFYTKQRRFYCGIDLHARMMYVCILSQEGEVVFHKNLPDGLCLPPETELAGKKSGKGWSKIGNKHLKWAFSEAAVLFLRSNPEGMKFKKRLVQRLQTAE